MLVEYKNINTLHSPTLNYTAPKISQIMMSLEFLRSNEDVDGFASDNVVLDRLVSVHFRMISYHDRKCLYWEVLNRQHYHVS